MEKINDNILEEWEMNYLHDLAIRNCQCKARNIAIPEEKYGVIKTIAGLWTTFHGDKFWEEMYKSGHDSVIFEKCCCKTGEKCKKMN